MKGLNTVFVVVLPAVILLGLLIVFLWRCCFKKRENFSPTPARNNESLESGITKLHLSYRNSGFQETREGKEKKRANYYVLRRGVLAKPLFNWSDHPWLISEAVENGWARFAFTSHCSSSLPRSSSPLWDLCAVCESKREGEADISWEITSGALECMQKIRLNSGSKTSNTTGLCLSIAALPLPGPALGGSSFPQEAYFEITLLSPEGEERNPTDGEKIKLIPEASMKAKSDSLIHVSSASSERSNYKSPKQVEGLKDEVGLITLGLAGCSPPPYKLPGTYPGSIGFNSNGSVHLDGIKLVWEAEQAFWGVGEKVIGCGFDPIRKKVIFTVDSQLVHEVYCKSEEFGSPLYPILAATREFIVLVNLGQSQFKYKPANLQRTPNPCFLHPFSDAPARALSYDGEDSRELFSMGRIDSEWLAAKRNGYDENMTVESEDFFEIVLDERRP